MNSRMAWWIVDQLVQQGVRTFCIAPGSRSTPLALAAAHHPGAVTQIHYDERGLCFFALGLGKGTQRPAAMIATSGTAVGNLLPAAMEAHHSSTPLILLTADRPPELLDVGANQATDQLKIFQPFVRGQIALPCADENVEESYVRRAMAQVVLLSMKTPGPVHVNWHIREPLFKPPFPELPTGANIPITMSQNAPLSRTSLQGRGAILIGRLPSPSHLKPILDLASKLQWPVFGDILSNARLTPTREQIRYFDWILKARPPQAETILHFGERMTSKKSLEYTAKRHIHVSPWPALQDPAHKVTERIVADPDAFCHSAELEPAPKEWLAEWLQLDRDFEERLESMFKGSDLCTEPQAAHALGSHLSADWSVFLGNGMPIRDADHFLFPGALRGFFANRGLSGIDGNIATAAGIALAGPVAIWIGDQATLHDLNSLSLLASAPHPIVLIASNNFGSGIFSHLPIASGTPHFERLFANAHDWEFEGAARMFRLPYRKVESVPDFIDAWKSGQTRSSIIELITSRAINYQFQREIVDSCISLTGV